MNWKSLSLVALIVAGLVAITACSGYTLADYTKVKVPRQIQESTGSKPTEPLSRAPFVRERYVAEVKSNLAEFDQSIEDAQLFTDFIGSLLNTGLEVSAGPIQSLPAGGVILAALGGLAGLFVRRPGDGKKMKDAEDRGYDMGRTEALDTVKRAEK